MVMKDLRQLQKQYEFSEVEIGQCFEYQGEIYLKISDTETFNLIGEYQVDFDNDDLIIPVKAEIHITEY